MSNEEQSRRAIAMATMHVDALHDVCAGIEKIVDARVAAAVYVARAGQILATLRKHKLTDRNEIDQLAELMTVTAMTDTAAVGAHDPAGDPILTAEEKAKLN